MKRNRNIALTLVALYVIAGCATILPGNDPVVVNAERVTAAASDTFDAAFQLEYQNHALLKQKAPQEIAYVNYVRTNAPHWLSTARSLTDAYKQNRSQNNKANLDTILSTLQAATNQLGTYFPSIKAP